MYRLFLIMLSGISIIKFLFVAIQNQKNFEIGFASEAAFLEYVQNFGINQPQWVEPNIVYREFSKTGCFDWIPDCE